MNRHAFAQLFLCAFLILGLTVAAVRPSVAAQPRGLSDNVLVIGTDRGGLLRARSQFVEELRRNGRRVEIRGELCLSSCTMFLGAADVCVNPRTVFGFHGPSYYGRKLPADQFEYWSQVMSKNFPPHLHSQFMKTWRYRIDGYVSITGVQLINMGYRSC
ncbi:MAG: hypothetical protein ACKVKF_12505 [Rhodobacterales bacterium]|uniref:hypothetical protein n=1 Tax=Puniceibacterium antarcticum TaxID=1206336 RepID=UPI00117AD3C3|nr:hypothetical protein [Puniceibacterium antarcticum]